jgi:GNAT superfamily N-acetyltransferase
MMVVSKEPPSQKTTRRGRADALQASGDTWILDLIVVAKSHRKEGLASHLVAKLRQEAVAQGRKLQAKVMLENDDAFHLLCGKGMRPFEATADGCMLLQVPEKTESCEVINPTKTSEEDSKAPEEEEG